MFALVSEVFQSKATNGKIPNADAMNAYYALQDQYVEVGINEKEEVEDLKLVMQITMASLIWMSLKTCTERRGQPISAHSSRPTT